MNDIKRNSGFSHRWPVVLLSFLLFYIPSVLAIFGNGDEPWEWVLFSIVTSTFYALVFCINYFRLVPSMLIRNDRRVGFFVVNICLVILICGFVPVCFETVVGLPKPHPAHPGPPPTIPQILVGYLRFVIRDGVMLVLSAALAYALRLSGERDNIQRRELELRDEQRQVELRSLKAQLNPHFLFNSLNNIYALIGIAPEDARQSLHSLSGMLRFMIYDAGSRFVPLEKELSFITAYVELMKLRLASSVDLKCDIRSKDNGEFVIAPLLLLTLVENAFKHHAPNNKSSFIHISVTVSDGQLECLVRNSQSPQMSDKGKEDSEQSGVGLENIRRQLRLIYPRKHSLSISETADEFEAALSVSLSKPEVTDRPRAHEAKV